MRDLNAILTIAYRDLLKLLRDRGRIIGAFIAPIFFVGGIGGTLQAGLGDSSSFDVLQVFVVGIFAATLFQSAAQGIISLVEDRESDFSQELFIAPVSRYSIVFGKILGETSVALLQGAVVLLFGLILQIKLGPAQFGELLVVGILAALLGGAFGTLLVSAFPSQRSANQVLPFFVFPQIFLAGVLVPLRGEVLKTVSLIAPLRYVVDLAHSIVYGYPDAHDLVLLSPIVNLAIVGGLFAIFLVIGTTLFVRSERTR